MRRGPARGRLVGEGSEMAAAVSLKFDLLAQVIGKVQRIAEGAFVDGDQRRREHGRVTPRQRMLIMSGGDDEHVFVVTFLNRPQQLVTALYLLQPMFGYAQGEVHDLALPDIDGPVQRSQDNF